jgi:hypothetical protein
VAPYGQPLWDESESVTVDSSVRILVPMYDSLTNDIVGLWCFDNRLDSDTVYYGIAKPPPALNDTAFAIDLNLVYDYFRFKLGLPMERNVRFEGESSLDSASVDITPQSTLVALCKTMCASVTVDYYGKESTIELGCFTTCTFYMMPVPYDPDDLPLFDDGDLGGGGGGNENSQKKTYTITVSATTGGAATGGGTYPDGSLIALSARANENYIFEHWTLSGSIVSTSPTYALTVFTNQAYVAKFISEDCYNARQIAGNTILNGAVALLKGEAQSKTNEVSRFSAFYNGANTTGSREGSAGEVGFPNLNGGTYNWMFHTHPSGAGVIFSGRDLMSLYQIYASHLYTDLASFLWGIVNHYGGGYALAINNPALFEQFAKKYKLDSNDPEYIMDRIDRRISLYNASRAENFFTKFINGSGLSLWKTDDVGSSQNMWDGITYNTGTKKVTKQPCD